MEQESNRTIMVAAAPADVWAVISDFARYPEWADSMSLCEVVDRHRDGSPARVRFVVDSGLFRDDYVLAFTWSSLRLDWTLVTSELQRSQVGSYALLPADGGTLVTYRLAIELTIPLLATLRRRAEQTIMDTALESLKARVEIG